MARRDSSSNPALTRIPAFSGVGVAGDAAARPARAGGRVDALSDPLERSYRLPDAGAAQTGRMTVDDVVVKTAMMLGLAVLTGAVTWSLNLQALTLPAALVGLVLGLVITFKQVTNSAAMLAFAAVEGVFLGGISKLIGGGNEAIVLQAVLGTVAVAGVMLALFRSGRLRVTPKFQRAVIGATLGFLVLMVVNLLASLFTDGGLGLRDGGPLAVVVSLVAIALAAFNLVLDFDLIDKAVRQGVAERYSWLAAFGLVVTLVWLYVEILRLLSYFSDRD